MTLEVSGTGGSLATSPTASPDGSSEPVFYVAPATARRLTGGETVDEVLLRLHDAAPAAADATVEPPATAAGRPAGDVVTDLPEVREPGDCPGRDLVEQITSLFQVVTLLAFVSALFLVANTMNTLVAEQGAEIAVMKAIGGRRRQVAGVFVRSALLVGVAGAVLGTVLGIGVRLGAGRLLHGHVRRGGRPGGRRADGGGDAGHRPAGRGAATLPALRPRAPALGRRGARRPGRARRRLPSRPLDRLVARAGLLPPSARLGLRNALRQRRRSAATVAQLTLAVAAALALLGLGGSIGATIDDVYDHLDYDVVVQSDDGAPAFDAAARRVVEGVDGVADAAPVLVGDVEHGGDDTLLDAMGLDPGGHYLPALDAGRWLTDDELAAAPRWPCWARPRPGLGRRRRRRRRPGHRHRHARRRGGRRRLGQPQRGDGRVRPAGDAGRGVGAAGRRRRRAVDHRGARGRG